MKEKEQHFSVHGQYYERDGERYRRLLEIRQGELDNKSDALVVMMNPGGSEPINKKYEDVLTPAHPDRTQHKIMKLMLEYGWRKATVINTSDLVEKKSYKFNSKLKKLPTNHTIFHKSRREELRCICANLKPNAKIIVAWGVARETFELRESAYNFLIENIGATVGYAYGEDEFSYLHPLAHKFGKGEFQFGGFKWDLHMIEKINESKRNS